MQKNVGLVGLGLLGSALAERLLRLGYSVYGYDVNQDACRKLGALGGTPVESLRDLTVFPSILFSLPDSTVVESVVREVTPWLQPNSIVLDTTTGDPDRTVEIGQHLAALEVDYLDATVLGSSEQARHGDVLGMVGGRIEAIVASEAILTAIARRWFHMGPCGSGARMKLVVNLVLGLNRAVLAEGLSFASKCGINPRIALDVLRDGAAYSKVMDTKGEKMLSAEFAPQARLAQHLKDVHLILSQGDRVGAKLPLSTVHEELLQAVVEMGGADEDNCAVIRAFN